MKRIKCLAFVISTLVFLGTAADLNYRLVLTVFPDDESWKLSGVATVSGFLPEGAEELVFRLYQAPTSPFHLLSARWDETILPINHFDPTTFSVPLPHLSAQTFSVTLEYAVTVPPFPSGTYGIFSCSENTVVIAQGYPILAPWAGKGLGWVVEPALPWGDAVVAEVADYEVEIAFPPGWTVVATGEETELEPGKVLVRGENLREFALVLVKDYEVITDEERGMPVFSWFPSEVEEGAKKALEYVAQSLDFFSKTFGEYPFREMDVVAVPLQRAAGVEFPGLILAATNYYSNFEDFFFHFIFAHETAHQWWYALVGNNQVAEPWLDEALADYCAVLVMDEWGMFSETLSYLETSFAQGRLRNPEASPFDPLWKFPDGRGYGGIVYSGGALFFLELEGAMGKEKMIEALRQCLEQYRWRIAKGTDLLSVLTEKGGEPAQAVITRWLSR